MSRRYDYLVVGAGLFGATFAYRPNKLVSGALSLTSVPILEVISIVKILKV